MCTLATPGREAGFHDQKRPNSTSPSVSGVIYRARTTCARSLPVQLSGALWRQSDLGPQVWLWLLVGLLAGLSDRRLRPTRAQNRWQVDTLVSTSHHRAMGAALETRTFGGVFDAADSTPTRRI